MMDLKNKKVTILGLGRSGFALAELIDRLCGKVKISEKAPRDTFKAQFEKWDLKNKVQVEFGGHTESFIQDSDLVVLSPGVRIDAQPLQWANKKKDPGHRGDRAGLAVLPVPGDCGYRKQRQNNRFHAYGRGS